MELGGTFLLKNLIKLAARMMHGGDYPECVRVHRGSVSAALDRPAAWRALQPCEPLRHPRYPPRVRLPHQPRFALPDAHFGARAWAGGRAVGTVVRQFPEGFAVEFDFLQPIEALEHMMTPPKDLSAYVQRSGLASAAIPGASAQRAEQWYVS